MSAERRENSRRRTYLGGNLRFAVFSGATTCVVRNVSETGACIDVGDALWVPAHFAIDIPHLSVEAAARVVWRRGNAIGVSFEILRSSTQQTNTPASAAGKSLHDRILFLEQERAKLSLRVRQLTDEV